MKTRLVSLWDSFRSSFWFVPSLMAVGAFAMALGMIMLDQSARGTWIETLGWAYTGGPEGARTLLSTVAGSVITVAGTVFSITIAALTLASTQFGPRMLRSFIRDTGNQIVLGTFIATFLYCLLVLRTVRGAGEQGSGSSGFVPNLSVTLGIVLAVVSLGVLIYFIHHVASSVQANHLIAVIGGELDSAIDRLFPGTIGHAAQETGKTEADARKDIPADFEQRARQVLSTDTGYLQAIDDELLLRVAGKRNLVVRLNHHPGEWVVRGNLLAHAWPGEQVDKELTEALNEAFILGNRRTLVQDIEFPVQQLVEIALRALSPAINDPFTAVSCVDRLGASLCRLAHTPFPSPFRYDDAGQLRVIAEPITFASLVDTAFSPIRQYGRTSSLVTNRLLETIALIAAHVAGRGRPEDCAALRRQADRIECGCREGLADEADREEVYARHRAALQALTETKCDEAAAGAAAPGTTETISEP